MNIRRTVSGLALLVAVAAVLAGCGGSGGGPILTGAAPTVSVTSPTNGATLAPTNSPITATFSQAMMAATLTTSSFTASSPQGPLSGGVSCSGNLATFVIDGSMPANTLITVRITTAATNMEGVPIAANYKWTFTTGISTAAPTVISTNPLASASGVSVDANISATFSEAMDGATINVATFSLKGPGGSNVAGSVSYANATAVFVPSSRLASNAVYVATIGTGVKDHSGASLASPKSWTFTTASNGTPPSVVSTNPVANATNVPLNQSVNATFSEAMLASSINTSTFTVAGVTGTVTYYPGSRIATFRPSSNLNANTTYTAQIQTGAQDTNGNDLTSAKTWTFTTGTQLAQTNVNLGAASTYAVLAGSTVTNGGPTVVNGDLGVSPGSAVTGFPPGIVNGSVHAGDAAAAQAKTALGSAEVDAAGRLGAITLPGDLSGLTFTPGLYKNSTSVMLSAGNVTLDAQGDPDAVFVFQMGSTLTTSTGTQVVLAGGAQAKNIYWSVGSSATLGVNSVFNGVILAAVSITVSNGATSSGCMLTGTGAVSLQANTITR